MTALEQAKQSLPLPDLMARLGLADRVKKRARCPLHDDSKPSFSVYQNDQGEWRWKCHAGCGSGDEADFLAAWEKLSNGAACRRLVELTGSRATASRPRVVRHNSTPVSQPPEGIPIMPDAVADAWNEGVDYLLARPVTAVRLASFRGWPVQFAQYLIDCAAISMPLCYNERGVAFQVIAPEGESGSMSTRPVGYHVRLKGTAGEKCKWLFSPNEKMNNQSIPALPYVLGEFERARLLVITEGQWDALTFALAAGWVGDGALWPSSVGLIGIRGASGVKTFLRWYDRFWPDRVRCLLLADADKAGGSWSEGSDCFAKQLAKRCTRVAVVDCHPHKDFNDLYRAEKPAPEVISELLASHDMAVEGEVLP
jgi:CHC2 zinc finger